MGSRDHSITCETCGVQRGGLNDYKCLCDETSTRGTTRYYAKKRESVRAVQWNGEMTPEVRGVVRDRVVRVDGGQLEMGGGWYARIGDWIYSTYGEAGEGEAADAVVEQPPVEQVPIFTWTGGYFGLQGGYAWTKPNADTDLFGLGNVSSGMFGGYAGYNWQNGAWVFGAEGDFNGVWNDKTFNLAGPAPLVVDIGTDWLASIRGRAGYAIDRTLIFATGGVAFTEASVDVTDAAGLTFSGNKTLTGWTLGGGVEYAFTDNWIGRAEYRYYDFGNVDGPTALGSVDFQSQTLSVGVAYKF
jgi:outer membrane immunogenic protein